MALINELQKIGLSDKEAKVYLAMLELGQVSVQEISKKSGVNRATTYVILDSLMQKGLCSTYHKDKKEFYMAESPERIVSVLELQKKEIDEQQKQILGLMPQLKAIYNKQENKPVVRFFEGKDGLMTMVKEQMNSKAELLRMIYSVDDLRSVFSENEISDAFKERVSNKMKTKVLFTSKEVEKREPNNLDQRIQISQKDFPIHCDIALFNNKIRIASLGNKLNGVIIEDKNITDTLKSLFELAWLGAQTLGKKK